MAGPARDPPGGGPGGPGGILGIPKNPENSKNSPEQKAANGKSENLQEKISISALAQKQISMKLTFNKKSHTEIAICVCQDPKNTLLIGPQRENRKFDIQFF